MPNWRKVVVSGSAPILSGLTVKGPLEVSMTASSGTIPLSILAASDLSTDTLIKIRDDGNSYDLLTLDSEGAIRIREAGNSGEGGGIYVQSGGTTADHANMYINGGTARLSISSNTNGSFTVVPGGQSNGYLVGLTGKGTMALGQSATSGTKPSENNTNTLYIKNGTNPTNTPTDSFALFSKDVNSGTGTASPTFLTEDGTTIQLGSTSTLANVTATTFVKSGGTSAQFLKADGSVDSNTYSTATGVENNADVTDATNVAAAGALMASSNLSDVSNSATARTNLGAAKVGANSDITSLSGLTTALSVAQGGTGLTELGSANTFLTVNGDGDALEFTGDITGMVTTTGAQSIAGNKTFTDEIIMKNGSLTSPGIGFSDGNGFFRFLSDTIGVTIGDSLVAYWDNSSTSAKAYALSSGVQLRLGAGGTDSRPDLVFSSTEPDTGFYRSGVDEISISRAGSQAFKFDANGFQQLAAGGTSQFAGHLQAHCLGIGGTPSTTSGEIWAYGDIVANKSSDRRLKKYIKNIKNPLDKLSKINGVTFEWKKTDEKMKKEVHSHEGHDVGVIAQEIEEILPEIVATRDNGYKAVYYEKLIPLLIESVKELKAEVDELKKFK